MDRLHAAGCIILCWPMITLQLSNPAMLLCCASFSVFGWGELMFTMCSWVIVSKRAAHTYRAEAALHLECVQIQMLLKRSANPRLKNDPGSGQTCCRHKMAGLAPTTSAHSQICPGALDPSDRKPLHTQNTHTG